MKSIFYFGGYRQSALPCHGAVSAIFEAFKPVRESKINLWRDDPADTLLARRKRSRLWLEKHVPIDNEIIIAGYSMGAHLAAKFALDLIVHGRKFDQLYLFAPDPKFHESEFDRWDKKCSPTSAFDEAKELWQCDSAPGEDFSLGVRFVGEQIEKERVVVVYCEADEVAVWQENVERFTSLLAGSCTIFPIFAGSKINIGERMYVHLDPSKASSETWIHDQLFEMVAVEN
jgi:hypothetical protein